jgi:hypothetical protein
VLETVTEMKLGRKPAPLGNTTAVRLVEEEQVEPHLVRKETSFEARSETQIWQAARLDRRLMINPEEQ